MTVVAVDRTTWTQLNSAAKRLQINGGRLLVADSGAPAADDYHTYPIGVVFDATANKWGKALDTTTTWIVALDV
jgi:hypothetical protein